MKRAFYIALSMLLAAPAFAADAEKKTTAELTDPIEILKKMDAAAKAVKSVAYDIEFKASGDLVKHTAQGKGSVLMTGWTGRLPKQFLIDVTGVKPGATAAQHVTGGTDGENYFLIDYAQKIAHEDIDPNVMGTGGQLIGAALMPEFVHEAPFSDEINGKNQKLTGSEKVDDVDCYVITLSYTNAPQTSTWFVGKQDFLPRQRVDHLDQLPYGKGEITKTITRLVVDPNLDDDAFALKVPEGFKKTDDFAP
ncbi:MAG TPA: hypothetical protein P5572_06410 [Phycisphaerae bacterium]|nr:hypothetical protein [Phycisphaerae bacterium]